MQLCRKYIISKGAGSAEKCCSRGQRPVTQQEATLSLTYLRAPPTIAMMHVLLCLCLRPIPKDPLRQDLSWGYIRLAVNSATQPNCHLPSKPLSDTQLKRNARRRTVPKIDAAVRDITRLVYFNVNTWFVRFRLSLCVTSIRSTAYIAILSQVERAFGVSIIVLICIPPELFHFKKNDK